jgi:hypothetical protein
MPKQSGQKASEAPCSTESKISMKCKHMDIINHPPCHSKFTLYVDLPVHRHCATAKLPLQVSIRITTIRKNVSKSLKLTKNVKN